MSHDVPSPLSLIVGAKDRDGTLDDEIAVLFGKYSSRLVLYLRRHFGDAIAQEAAQEAFLRLYRKRSGGECIDNPMAWLTCVAHHAAIDQVRHDNLTVEWTPEVVDSVDAREPFGQTPEEICSRHQRTATVKKVLAELSDVERACLIMRSEGATLTAIGDHVQLDFRRVAEIIHRVVKKLSAAHASHGRFPA
jgi:RNA polymerase sigma factor (sigma-70 family)